MPNSIVFCDGVLYVYNFDTVRKVTIAAGSAAMTETLIGALMADTNPDVMLGAGNAARFTAFELTELIGFKDGEVLLSDPKNCSIYEVSLACFLSA